MLEFFQITSAMFTPGAAMNLLDAPRLPRWIGEKLNADLSLIKDQDQIIVLMQQAQQLAEQAIEQQQPGQQPQEPLSVGP